MRLRQNIIATSCVTQTGVATSITGIRQSTHRCMSDVISASGQLCAFACMHVVG